MSKENGSPGKGGMGSGGIVTVTIYLLTAIVVIIWALVSLWPAPIKPEEGPVGAANNNQSSPPAPNGPTVTTAPPGQTTTAAGQNPAAPPTGQTTTTVPPGQTRTAAAGQTATPPPAGPNATATPTPAVSPVQTEPTASPAAALSQDDCEKKHRIIGEDCFDAAGKKRKGVSPAKVFGWCGCLYDEDRLLWLVLLAGALGSLIHGLRSFVWYVGNRKAVLSWSAYYIALPFIGGGIALIFYLVIRGGFFSSTSTVANTSPIGFAAIAALIGMFTEQAVQKLKSVSETILSPAEKGEDHIDAPKINSITPAEGPTAGGTEVKIEGTDFSPSTKVTFGGAEAIISETPTAGAIKVVTPAHEAGKVDVVVLNPGNQKDTKAAGYEYKNGDSPSPPSPEGTTPATNNGDADESDVHDVELKTDTLDEELPITEGGVG